MVALLGNEETDSASSCHTSFAHEKERVKELEYAGKGSSVSFDFACIVYCKASLT